MKDEKTRYAIGELAVLAGVSRRTIRYYVQRDLIPEPKGRGRGNHYTQEHLDRILQIRSLQQKGVSLERIPDVLAGKEIPSKPEEINRILVTRIEVAEGVFLEFSGETQVPSPGALQDLVREIQQVLISQA